MSEYEISVAALLRDRLGRQPVIVLGCQTFTGARIVQQLLAAGISVALMWKEGERKEVLPKLLGLGLATAEYPHPFDQPEQFVKAVADFDAKIAGAAVFARGAEVFTLARYREQMPDTEIIAPQLSDLLRVHNKANLPAIASRAGVLTPATVKLFDTDRCSLELSRERLSSLQRPLVIKRVHSTGGHGTLFVQRPHSDEVNQVLDSSLLWPSVAQQLVRGQVYSVGVAVSGDQAHSLGVLRDCGLPHEKAGWILMRETVDQPEIESAALAVAKTVGISGILHLEFIRADDGLLYLIEVNPRVWTGMSAVMNAGVNAPVAMLAAHLNLFSSETQLTRPRIGTRSYHVSAAVSSFADHLRHREFRAAGALSLDLLRGRCGSKDVKLEDGSLVRTVLRKTYHKFTKRFRSAAPDLQRWHSEWNTRDTTLNSWDPSVPI